MKVKIIIWALILIWFMSCSFEDPAEDFTFENYKINIAFETETFELDSIELKVDLDPIAFPESLKVAPIRDSTSQDFNNLLNIILLTVSGQFSITNAFISIIQDNHNSFEKYYSIGKFKSNESWVFQD